MKGFGGFGGGDFFWRNSSSPKLPAWPAPVLLFLSEGLRAYRIPVSSGAGCLCDDHTSKVQCSKNFSGSIFFFSQNEPACSSLILSRSCLEAMLSFPCILPMQADKKRGTSTSLCSYNGTPSEQPPHQSSWEGKRRDWGWEREPYLQKGSLSHPQTWFSINSAPRRREAFPAAGAYTAS